MSIKITENLKRNSKKKIVHVQILEYYLIKVKTKRIVVKIKIKVKNSCKKIIIIHKALFS